MMISGVVGYSSSSGEDDDEATHTGEISHKRKPCLSNYSSRNNDKDCGTKRLKRDSPQSNLTASDSAPLCTPACLPLPSVIHSLYDTDSNQRQDDATQHGGRVRSFDHVEGNWATFVYFPISQDERLLQLFSSLLLCLRPHKFELMSDFHVTLSRTVTIRHHWIDSLMESLKENFASCNSSICDIMTPKLLRNDEKTRTFVCLEIDKEGSNLQEYVDVVDRSFDEFKLQPYYKEPSFHVSFGWCLGDVTQSIPPDTFVQMKNKMAACFHSNPDLSVLDIHQVECKTGKKVFRFQLQDDDTSS